MTDEQCNEIKHALEWLASSIEQGSDKIVGAIDELDSSMIKLIELLDRRV